MCSKKTYENKKKMRKKLIYEKNHYIKVSLKRSFLPENIKLFFNYHEIEIKNLKVRTEYS